MMLIGIGQIIAGLTLLVSGAVLAVDGHSVLGFIALAVGVKTLADAFHRIDPPSDGFREAHS